MGAWLFLEKEKSPEIVSPATRGVSAGQRSFTIERILADVGEPGRAAASLPAAPFHDARPRVFRQSAISFFVRRMRFELEQFGSESFGFGYPSVFSFSHSILVRLEVNAAYFSTITDFAQTCGRRAVVHSAFSFSRGCRFT
jgi:hypothetical protein